MWPSEELVLSLTTWTGLCQEFWSSGGGLIQLSLGQTAWGRMVGHRLQGQPADSEAAATSGLLDGESGLEGHETHLKYFTVEPTEERLPQLQEKVSSIFVTVFSGLEEFEFQYLE